MYHYHEVFLDKLRYFAENKSKSSDERISLELGMNKGYLNQILNKRKYPSFPAFYEMCQYFDVQPEDFFHESTTLMNEDKAFLIHKIDHLLQDLSNEELNALLLLLKRKVD